MFQVGASSLSEAFYWPARGLAWRGPIRRLRSLLVASEREGAGRGAKRGAQLNVRRRRDREVREGSG